MPRIHFMRACFAMGRAHVTTAHGNCPPNRTSGNLRHEPDILPRATLVSQ